MKMKGEVGNYVVAKAKLYNYGEKFLREVTHWHMHILGANKREASNEITVNFLA
jgi:diadenosine tetraphosphate (Ap4A) HIT family hydrolase